MNNINILDLVSIAELAGEKILEAYNQKNLFDQTEVKSDNSPLTLADKVSNTTICNFLQTKYPLIPIISEENKNDINVLRSEYFWLVDPLDGTKEFIKRNGEFTVNIALVHKGVSVMGVVSAPCLNKTYFGVKGTGSYLKQNNTSRQIHANNINCGDANLSFVVSRSHLDDRTLNFIEKFTSPKNTQAGSSLKFMLIAEGIADIYPRFAPTMFWDTAAAQVILEEAGGLVLNTETKSKLNYTHTSLKHSGFIALANLSDPNTLKSLF